MLRVLIQNVIHSLIGFRVCFLGVFIAWHWTLIILHLRNEWIGIHFQWLILYCDYYWPYPNVQSKRLKLMKMTPWRAVILRCGCLYMMPEIPCIQLRKNVYVYVIPKIPMLITFEVRKEASLTIIIPPESELYEVLGTWPNPVKRSLASLLKPFPVIKYNLGITDKMNAHSWIEYSQAAFHSLLNLISSTSRGLLVKYLSLVGFHSILLLEPYVKPIPCSN